MKEEIESKLERLERYVDELRNLSKTSLSEFKKDRVERAVAERFFSDVDRDSYRYLPLIISHEDQR